MAVGERLAMTGEAMGEFVRVLANFEPAWVLYIVVAAILAYRSPLIIKELFAGVGGLLKGRAPRKPRCAPTAHHPD
jgi:hypothetical protein